MKTLTPFGINRLGETVTKEQELAWELAQVSACLRRLAMRARVTRFFHRTGAQVDAVAAQVEELAREVAPELHGLHSSGQDAPPSDAA